MTRRARAAVSVALAVWVVITLACMSAAAFVLRHADNPACVGQRPLFDTLWCDAHSADELRAASQ